MDRSMCIELRTITRENLEAVLNLSVFDCQKAFVSSTAHALSQAYIYRNTSFPFAIYADDILVGFIMLGFYEDKKQYTLWKFLIDKNHQNKGYGKEALLKGIQYLKDTFNTNEIYTGVSPKNQTAKHLYHSIGFRETGIFENDMQEMKYIC